jgi:hypothetical protein
MIVSTGKRKRIAYCECGARLAGESDQELFTAADRHIARHHPQWLPERRASSLSHLVPDWTVGGATGPAAPSRARGDEARLQPTA